MKIRCLTLYLTGIPLKKPFNISVSKLTRQENILVCLETEEGIQGWGEAQPAPGFSSDTRATIAAVIKEYLAPAILGLDVREADVLSRRLDQALPGNHYAKGAVLDAALDAAARSYGVPLVTLLGGAIHQEIPCAWVVGLQETQKMVEEALWAKEQGFGTLKLKVGKNPANDLANIKAVRDAVGSAVKIRLDANQGYTLAQAIPTLRRASAYDIEVVEQPVAARDLTGLRRIQESTYLPVMADESAESPQDMFDLAKTGSVDVVNIKPAKNGGLHRARKCLDLVLLAGIEPSFSSNFASSMGVAAVGALALTSPRLDFAVEFHLGPLMLTGDLCHAPLLPEKGGLTRQVILGDGTGTGRAPDPGLLGKYTDQMEVLK